jgi:single-strand DNA-binding protein
MNQVILEGNTGRDPDVRFLSSGVQVANLTLATSNDFLNRKTGQWEKRPASWHNIVGFGEAATSLSETRKGEKIKVEGKLVYREYTGKDGVKRYITEIHVFKVEASEGKKPPAKQEKPPADDNSVPF